jgi:hypothetical protein
MALVLSACQHQGDATIAGPDGRPRFTPIVRLRVERGSDRQELQLDGPRDLFGHRISLMMARDGEFTPGGPREQYVSLRVGPLPPDAAAP